MNLEGYRKIQYALNKLPPGWHGSSGIEITPRPEPNEDKEWVTICFGHRLVPAAILNALSEARLLDGPSGPAGNGPPSLHTFGPQVGMITFRDMSYNPSETKSSS